MHLHGILIEAPKNPVGSLREVNGPRGVKLTVGFLDNPPTAKFNRFQNPQLVGDNDSRARGRTATPSSSEEISEERTSSLDGQASSRSTDGHPPGN